MKLEIPVKVYFDDVQGMIDEIQKLQTYKLFEGDDMVLVNLDAVATIMANHIRATDKCSETPNGWIPCSERLPEEDGDYLVTFEEGYAEDYGLDLVGIAPYEVDCEGFGIWQEEFDPHTLGSLGSEWVDIHVIAWQPLPEKFKEEGGEE